MSNSKLTAYTKISPNRTSPRDYVIDTITIHCYVGQASVEDMGAWFAKSSAQASSNYGIGKDGRVGLFVEEKDRSWCTSNRANDMRAITIECTCNPKEPYAINDAVYKSLIRLCADICQRNGIKKLVWSTDKNTRMNHLNGCNMTVHRDYAAKACPGQYIYDRLGKIASEVNALLGETDEYTPQEWIGMMAPIAVALAEKNRILPSVVIAQTALETGWGKTDLTRKYNTTGMKADLINNTWKDFTVWDGTTYEKTTPEYHNGQLVYVRDAFRVYKSFREGLEDYEAFLLHVQNNKGYKYARIQGLTDPATVIHYIRIGTGTDAQPEGYCTDPAYETKILNLITQYNLTQYDSVMKEAEVKTATEAAIEMNKIVLADIKAGKKWVYYNSGQKKTFDLARESKVYRVNCNLGVIWCYRKIGLMQKTGNIYGKNGHFQMSDSTRKLMMKRFDLLDFKGRYTTSQLVKAGKLQAGDIVSYKIMTHTNMFIGNGKWFDTGHAFCKSLGDGAPFVKWVGDNPYPNEPVGEVLRFKEDPKPGSRYRVKVGAYKTLKSASKRASAVTKKSGLDCFIESTDKHRVYCGSFSNLANAEVRLKELNDKGVMKAKIVEAG